MMPHTPHTAAHPEDGFTLVEMLAVLAIIATLGTVIFLTIAPQLDRADQTKAQADINALEQAVEVYRMSMGTYPDSLEDLVRAPRDSELAARFPQDGFIKSLNKDPWGEDYIYAYPGENGRYDISSLGADKEPGGEGNAADITSWKS